MRSQRQCNVCGRSKPEFEFELFRDGSGRRRVYCAECEPLRNRNFHLRHRFGITVGDFNRMLERQNGLCAACKEAPGTQVDHDHRTNKVRAILCLKCNAALGALKDDPRLVYQALEYLDGPMDTPEFIY